MLISPELIVSPCLAAVLLSELPSLQRLYLQLDCDDSKEFCQSGSAKICAFPSGLQELQLGAGWATVDLAALAACSGLSSLRLSTCEPERLQHISTSQHSSRSTARSREEWAGAPRVSGVVSVRVRVRAWAFANPSL